jgi:hypothetical protein
MRFRVRLERRLTIHWGFIDHCERTEQHTKARCFTNVSSFSPDNPIQRSGVVKEQRKRSSGLTLAAQFQLCYHKSPTKWRNLSLLPFQAKRRCLTLKVLAFPLGPTNPRTIAVHSEPLSTSAITGFMWLIATTTKICTRDCSSLSHDRAFAAIPTPSYTSVLTIVVTVWYRSLALALSIFRAGSFGRWVVTHSLAGFDFHDHRPAVSMNQHLLWCLISECLAP